MSIKAKLSPLAVAIILAVSPLHSSAENTAEGIKVMEEYLEFTEYGGATIWPEQIPAEDWKRFYVIDARDADQFKAEHIPGAVNIDWRQVLARRAELPQDKPILIYCNSGTLSAQAGFALRVAGMDNVRILQGGLQEWKQRVALMPIGVLRKCPSIDH